MIHPNVTVKSTVTVIDKESIVNGEAHETRMHGSSVLYADLKKQYG
jgi:hypothetical protein